MTNTYDTSGEPLGSKAPKVLYNNASNFDDAMNAFVPSWVDRFGRDRMTWYGFEQKVDQALINLGYQFIGDYDADGPLLITERNQAFTKDGEYWHAGPSLILPYTTVNNWAIDQPKFVSIGDASLRSALAAATGAQLVGYRGRNVYQSIDDIINIKDRFGAVGDGVTDDTAAFNAAIAYANSRGSIDFLNVTGTTIFIPTGRYKIGALDPITRSGCEFVGSSRNGTVLLLASNTQTFRFGNGVDIVVGGGVSNVKLEYLGSPPGASSIVFMCDLAYRLKFSELLVANIGVLAQLGFSDTRPAGGIVFTGIDGSKANVSCPLFAVNFGAGLFLDGVNVFIPVPHPVHPASMTTVAGCSVFNCFTGFWDTIQASRCLFERFDIGLSVVATPGLVYQNMYFSNVIMDYFRRYAVYAESQAGGVISGIRFDNTSWFVSWETSCIELIGPAGYHDNHEFMGKVVIAGAAGIKYSLANAKNVCVNGMQINSVNRLGTANGAVVVDPGSQGLTLIGCRGNVDTTGLGFPWRAPYGVDLGSNADNYVITGNKFEGSTGAFLVNINGAGSTNRLLHDNAGVNYAISLGLALPASGVPLTNTTPFKIDFHINGGNVTGISRNGVGLTGMTSGTVSIDPGQSITVTYTVAPSLASFART